MATLSVLKFNQTDGANQALDILQRLQQQQLIQVMDWAVVSWPRDSKAPRTKQALNTTGAGALGGSFWGLLLGLIFLMPLLGAVVGAVSGAIGGALTDIGIDDDFIEQVRQRVTPGTSALFLMSGGEVADRVVPELRSLNPELVTTNLSADEDARLRELFGGQQVLM